MSKIAPFLMFNDQLEAVMDAMLEMVKLDVAAPEIAYDLETRETS